MSKRELQTELFPQKQFQNTIIFSTVRLFWIFPRSRFFYIKQNSTIESINDLEKTESKTLKGERPNSNSSRFSRNFVWRRKRDKWVGEESLKFLKWECFWSWIAVSGKCMWWVGFESFIWTSWGNKNHAKSIDRTREFPALNSSITSKEKLILI